MSAAFRSEQGLDAGGGAGSGYGRGDDLSSGAFNREDDLINHERTIPDNAGTVPSQPEAMMSLNFDDLESKLDRKTLENVGAWSELSQALRQPDLFAVDFSPDNFEMQGEHRFVGLVDLLLTYNDPVSHRDDQSVTVPATVRGHVEQGGSVVVDGLDLVL